MTREVRVSERLQARIAEWDADEIEEILELIELLREEDELDSLSDVTVVYEPTVVHYTIGQFVGISWRKTPEGVGVTNIDRYRPPPTDLA